MHRDKLKIIYGKTNGRCWYCGRWMHAFSDWQVEHQIPRFSGGTDAMENLVPACRECNAAKGKRNVEEYRRALVCKLEHAITTASELADEIEGFVAWDRQPDDERLFVSPAWLCEVGRHLHEAALIVVNTPFLFYGERLNQPNSTTTPVQETEAVA